MPEDVVSSSSSSSSSSPLALSAATELASSSALREIVIEGLLDASSASEAEDARFELRRRLDGEFPGEGCFLLLVETGAVFKGPIATGFIDIRRLVSPCNRVLMRLGCQL